MSLIRTLIQLYIYVIIGRIILSYFPINPGSVMAQIYGVLYNITEPVLGRMRRIVPPLGMIDLSPMIVILLLVVVQTNLS